jgi:hypothetical protein
MRALQANTVNRLSRADDDQTAGAADVSCGAMLICGNAEYRLIRRSEKLSQRKQRK